MAVTVTDQSFNVKGFDIKSKTFLLFLLICVVFSGLGAGLIFMLLALIIAYPIFYSGIYRRLTRRMVRISNNLMVQALSYIPNIDFRGKWYQTLRAEDKDLSSLRSIMIFIKDHFVEITTVHLIFLTWGLRFGFAFQSGTPNSSPLFFGLAPATILVACFLLPFFTGFYFVTIWTIQDSGLKLYRLKENTTGEEEFNELVELSDSFRTLTGFLFGIPNIFWFLDFARIATYPAFMTNLPFYVKAIMLVGFLFFLTIGVTWYSLIIYYRGETYPRNVNELRVWVRDSSRAPGGYIPGATPQQASLQSSPNQVQPQYSPSPRNPSPTSDQHPAKAVEPNDPPAGIPETGTARNFCMGCGAKLKPEIKFCTECGRKI